jgi:hypothetical protein
MFWLGHYITSGVFPACQAGEWATISDIAHCCCCCCGVYHGCVQFLLRVITLHDVRVCCQHVRQVMG